MDIKWFEKSGKEGDVVISSRIRLARNLQKIPFPIRMNEQQKRQVRDNIVQAAKYGCREGEALARKRTDIEYPDKAWGYGALDLYETLRTIREL